MDPCFHTTRWSVVLTAGAGERTRSRAALAELCRTYWYPLYAFARRRGSDPAAAEDRVQGFFAELLEKNRLEAADPVKGRFRAFLLTAFKGHLSREREKEQALKRGGGRQPFSIDFAAGERLYALEPAMDITPERIYERRWALTLLEQVMEGLRAEMEEEGKGELFAALRPFLAGPPPGEGYAEPAKRLDMSLPAVKTAMHRLRRRYRRRLRAEIAETLAEPGQVEEEIAHLMEALGG